MSAAAHGPVEVEGVVGWNGDESTGGESHVGTGRQITAGKFAADEATDEAADESTEDMRDDAAQARSSMARVAVAATAFEPVHHAAVQLFATPPHSHGDDRDRQGNHQVGRHRQAGALGALGQVTDQP